MEKEVFNEEFEYEKSFYPIMIWEKLCFLLLIVFFVVGAGVTFRNRIDKTPPEQLTIKNYQEFLKISAEVGTIHGGGQTLLSDGIVRVEATSGYTLYDLKAAVHISTNKGTLTNNEVLIDFMKLKGRESKKDAFGLKLSLPGNMDSWTLSLIASETRDWVCSCEIVSVSGRIAYEK